MSAPQIESSYPALIREAFIDPIRSVLIVDDNYPMLEDQIFLQSNSKTDAATNEVNAKKKERLEKKEWRENPDRINRVIDYFRARNWLVDIHDGHGASFDEEDQFTKHLHQSDLLILDYQLDGDLGDGEKCVKALRQLATNNYFNLVVIHTNAPSTISVFNDVLQSLLSPAANFSLDKPRFEQLSELIEVWEFEDPDIKDKLISSIDINQYMEIRRNFAGCKKILYATKDGGMFYRFFELYSSMPHGMKLKRDELLEWTALEMQKQSQFASRFFNEKLTNEPTWCPGENGKNWIRTDRLFITIASKQEANDLPDVLLKSLESWNPLPPRLALTKLRSVISSSGVTSEDGFISDSALQAGWYRQLLNSTTEKLSYMASHTSRTYWDGLSDSINQEVSAYTKKLVIADKQTNRSADDIVHERFKINLCKAEQKSEYILKHNCYKSSKHPEGWHLTIGHIFSFEDKLWICLSPACDLVPDQISADQEKRFKDVLPFTAVELHERRTAEALKNANWNTFVFIKINGDIKSYCILGNDNPGATPTTMEMHAKNRGKFLENSSMEFVMTKSYWCNETEGMRSIDHKATIIGQLRYEYALNLLQRVGASASRIGLDYLQYKVD